MNQEMKAPETVTDLEAVVHALATHERFLVVSHENPDGDALGSLLGDVARAPRARQGRGHVPRPGTAPLPAEFEFLRSTTCSASCRTTSASASCSRVDCANARRIGQDPALLDRAKTVVDVDHHHDNTRFGSSNLIVADASSTAEIVRDLLWELGVPLTPEIAEALYVGLVTDTGRFQYSNTTPKSLRLAAELVEAGADVHGIFRSVYETVQFAKLKLLARALDRAQLYEGGRLSSRTCFATDFEEVGAEEPYSEGIIDYLRQAEGAQMVALIREPPRRRRADAGASRCARARTRSTSRPSRARRAAAATGRPPASRASCRSRRSPSSSGASSSPRPTAWDCCRCRRGRVSRSGSRSLDKPAGPSSFALVADLRRRTGARTGHAGTLDPFATGLLVLLSGAATRLAPCFVGLDKRYVTEIDLTATTTTGDPEGEVVERHEPPAATDLDVQLDAPPRRGRAADPGRVGGEDRRRAGLRARARRASRSRCRVRRSQVYALDVARVQRRRARHARAARRAPGTYVRSIAAALGGHCRTLRRTAVGPFGSRRPTPTGCSRRRGARAAPGGGARARAERGARARARSSRRRSSR